jgi:UDP-2,3-diacylglucosamine pyrophosphatase LpxH
MQATNAPRPPLDSACDYLLLSDVHLGSDLVPHLRPWARSSWLTRDAEVDKQLISLLTHYRSGGTAANAAAGINTPRRRVCLVIAGDFLDLVGVSLTPEPGSVRTEPTTEERRHGLGSASDHVVHKVHAIAARHRRVFEALCDFLEQGHQLVVVRGNHDIELHWRAAQRALVEAISQHASSAAGARDVASRVRICPWFFAVEGLLYVEHGHEFDAMCSYGDPLLPTCPRDSRRIRVNPSYLMLRQVARPTRGLSTTSYENVGFGAYMKLLGRLGLSGSIGIALRFSFAVGRLLGECLASARGEGVLRKLRARARRRRFATQVGTNADQLSALTRLYSRPAVCSLAFVLRSLYLDRIFAVLFACACVAVGAYLARYRDVLCGVVCALPAALFGAYGCWGPNRDLAPTGRMRRCAAEIARLFDARFVVMGHTHEAERAALEAGATYVNLGHWGKDDVPEERSPHEHQTPCTYLWLADRGTGYRAELLRWDASYGARPYVADSALEKPRGTAAGGLIQSA